MLGIDAIIWYAIGGGFAPKILELCELHKTPKLERPDLKDWAYWIPFIGIPLLGGGLAQVYIASDTALTPLLAANIGVSAPLMIRAMAEVNPLQGGQVDVPDDA